MTNMFYLQCLIIHSVNGGAVTVLFRTSKKAADARRYPAHADINAVLFISTHTDTHMHTNIQAHIHTSTHSHTYTYMHTHTYTHTQSHTHIYTQTHT